MADKPNATPCPHCERTDLHSHRVMYPALAPERPLYSDQPGYAATDYQKLSRGECPACGFESNRWTSREDGGHDVVLGCKNCGAEFGVQTAPFYMVERL